MICSMTYRHSPKNVDCFLKKNLLKKKYFFVKFSFFFSLFFLVLLGISYRLGYVPSGTATSRCLPSRYVFGLRVTMPLVSTFGYLCLEYSLPSGITAFGYVILAFGYHCLRVCNFGLRATLPSGTCLRALFFIKPNRNEKKKKKYYGKIGCLKKKIDLVGLH